jgi:hypothetical protein
MALDQKLILKAELDKLLEGGFIIQVEDIEWAFSIIIVPKKGGKWKICINYRALNKTTLKDRQRIPLIDEILEDIARNERHNFCDGYSRYQIS